MIAYEELVSALALWRERNGLPVGSADYLGAPPPPTPVSFGPEGEDIDFSADGGEFFDGGEISADDAIIDETATADAGVADPYAEAADPYAEAADPYAEAADPYAEAADPYAEAADAYAEAEPVQGDADPYAAAPPSYEASDPYAAEAPGYDEAELPSSGPPPPPPAVDDTATFEPALADETDAGEVAAEYAAAPPDEEVAIEASDDAIIGEESVGEVGTDDVTSPQDFADDAALYPSVDEGQPSGQEEDVAFISSAAPSDDAPAGEPDLADFPAIDATQKGISPAPPADDETIDADAYPSVSSDDPTVEAFPHVTDDELGGGGDDPSKQ